MISHFHFEKNCFQFKKKEGIRFPNRRKLGPNTHIHFTPPYHCDLLPPPPDTPPIKACINCKHARIGKYELGDKTPRIQCSLFLENIDPDAQNRKLQFL